MRDKKLYEILEPEETSLIVMALMDLMEKYEKKNMYFESEIKTIRKLLEDDFKVYVEQKKA